MCVTILVNDLTLEIIEEVLLIVFEKLDFLFELFDYEGVVLGLFVIVDFRLVLNNDVIMIELVVSNDGNVLM